MNFVVKTIKSNKSPEFGFYNEIRPKISKNLTPAWKPSFATNVMMLGGWWLFCWWKVMAPIFWYHFPWLQSITPQGMHVAGAGLVV